MGLLDAYKKATTNWDAKKDKVQQNQAIPTGTYEVMLGKTDHPVYKSGWDCLRFDLQVIAGKYASRHEPIRVSLATKTTKGKDVPEFVASRNIRTIAKLGEMVGLDMKPEYFPDNETDAYEKLAAAFKPYEGKTLQVVITETPSKKDPDNPYRNYDFGPSKTKIETPEADKGESNNSNGDVDTTITDDELPF